VPETIDFQNEAQRLVDRLNNGSVSQPDVEDVLRRVWNARGAADIATLEHQLAGLMGDAAAGPYIKDLDRALRALDR
jgi:hypothetical protein